MSKQNFRKFRKNDYSYDDEEYAEANTRRQDKHRAKRIDRALKTKDISLLEDDENIRYKQKWNRY